MSEQTASTGFLLRAYSLEGRPSQGHVYTLAKILFTRTEGRQRYSQTFLSTLLFAQTHSWRANWKQGGSMWYQDGRKR